MYRLYQVTLFFLLTSWAQSQEPLVTDRPDVAESAVTVGAGRVQVETGLSLTKEDGAYATTFPTLVRVGLGDRLEFRVESDLFSLQNPGLNGLSDVAVGAKVINNDLQFDVSYAQGLSGSGLEHSFGLGLSSRF